MAVVTRATEVGFEFPSLSNQMRLERWLYREEMQQRANPGFHAAENIHTNPELAKKEGLSAPVAGGPLLMSHISRLMMSAFGEGWIKGGKATLKLIRPVYPDDFITAKGVITEKVAEDGGYRFNCDVWIENQRREKVLVGTTSGIVP